MKKILIIDDELDILTVLKERITAAGYETSLVSDGVTALEIFDDFRPDLVILDVMMPGLDGFQVCKILKSFEHSQRVPVIMLTAKREAVDREYGELVNADCYMTKPYEASELLANIEKLIGNK